MDEQTQKDLQLIDRVISQIRLSREEHAALMQALKRITDKLNKP